MVDLDPISATDYNELRQMIENHFQYTKSTVAKFIIDDFDNQLKNFIKVFPKDYKKVLALQRVKEVEEIIKNNY
jgi:glutamate synthase (NADPH/NADH) large chain